MSIRQQILSLSYFNRNAVENHGNDLVRNVPTLKSRVEFFTLPSGHRVQLLHFDGTIPVHYKGAQYNIPIKIWLDYRFPECAPYVYVVPTATMQVAERHKHVDAQGRCYLPYLHGWNAHNSSLNVLVIELMSCFAQQPPVYAKRANQQSRPAVNNYRPPAANYNSYKQPPPSTYNNTNNNNSSYNQPPPQQNNKLIVQEKTSREMKEVLEKELNIISKDIVDMMKKKHKIEIKKRGIERTFEKSNKEFDKLQERKSELEQECAILTSWLEQNEASLDIDVDNVVSASDTHAKQLFEVTAKDYAITDVLYDLEECLGDQTIDLSLFLRQIRKISREQFFERALKQKIEIQMKGGPRSPIQRPQPSPGGFGRPQNHTGNAYPNIPPPSYNNFRN